MKPFIAAAARIMKIAALWATIIPICLAGTILAAVIAASIAALCGLICTVVFVIIIAEKEDTGIDYLLAKVSEISAAAKETKVKP